MKCFSNKFERIKISFDCDLCGVLVELTVSMPQSGEITKTAVCQICFKEFEIIIQKGEGNSDSSITVSDTEDEDVLVIEEIS